jgi:ABC-type multidrug transport system fused ATPase/permease subunit
MRDQSVLPRRFAMRFDGKGKTNPLQSITVWALLKSRAHLLALTVLLIGINRAAGLVWPYQSKYLVDEVIAHQSHTRLLVLVGIGLCATLIQGLTSYVMTLVVNLSGHRLIAELRKRIQQHASRLPVSYYDANKTGAIVSRVMNDVEGVRNLAGGGVISFVGAVLTACISFVVLVRIHALLTMIVFFVYLILALILHRVYQKNRPNFSAVNVIRGDITGRLTESLGGVRLVKAYRAEPQEDKVFSVGIDNLLEKVLLSTRISTSLELSVVMVTGLVAATVTYLGARSIMAGTLTVGDLFQFVIFLGVLVAPLMQAVSTGSQFNEAAAGLERLRQLFAEPREDQDSARSEKIDQMEGDVRFESVAFAYGEDGPVLHDISFRARPGTVTALVGASGAGKSTMIGLIAGFYEASNGTVWIDNQDLSRVDLHSYRGYVGMVPQDAFLFSGTIRDNVAFGRPETTDEEVRRACAIARVDEFANRFELGYETMVGERGVRLSMGQRQRIAIARAILANPKILILDEATSSLDSVSESLIQEALSMLLQDRTTFVIAHRLSTIRRADQILVIDHGRVVESGTHQELLDAKGKYWEFYTTQYQLQSNLFLAPGEIEEAAASPASPD